jgi:hypothetical protein
LPGGGSLRWPTDPSMVRIENCGEAGARSRLAHARHYVDAAEAVHDERLEPSLNLTAALCVLAGIAACDAACCSSLGRRSRGQDHRQAQVLVAQVPVHGSDMAKSLRRLLNLKDEAQYGLGRIGRENASTALRHAKRLLASAERVVVD